MSVILARIASDVERFSRRDISVKSTLRPEAIESRDRGSTHGVPGHIVQLLTIQMLVEFGAYLW
jgi:hypothetical protein